MKKNVVIIILVMLVLGLGGYLVYDKVVDKDIEKESKEETIKEYDLDEAKKLVDAVILNNDYCMGFNNFFEMNTEIYKQLSVLNSYNGKDAALSGEDISGAKYVDCTKTTNNICNKLQNIADGYLSFDYEKVNDKYHSMFGSSSDVAKNDIKRILSWYEYDKDTDSFIQIAPSLGCIGEYLPELNSYKIKSAKVYDKELVVTIVGGTLELEIDYNAVGVGASYSYIDSASFFYYNLTKESAEMTDNDYENIKNKFLEEKEESLGTYEMTFIKENGKYYYSDMIRVY